MPKGDTVLLQSLEMLKTQPDEAYEAWHLFAGMKAAAHLLGPVTQGCSATQ